MARPQKHSDTELFERIESALSASPKELRTLAAIARAVDVHPATLIKRFGSKRELLLALSRRWVAALPSEAGTAGPAAALQQWINGQHTGSSSPELSNQQLAALIEDLADPELAGLLRQGWRKQISYLEQLVTAAVAQEQLLHAPTPSHAATLLFDACLGFTVRTASEPDAASTTSPPPASLLLESWT
ncbi:TetR/AcrR family transcriptional regulator [Arthrobacter pityocampae]|uniref:TetR/AcrR family transcriptional regulator n=1 Tax=Arthrobacter pityocampae TaxID=547334 RepID=UPI003736A12D